MALVQPGKRRSSSHLTPGGLEIVIPARRHLFFMLFLGVWLCGWTMAGFVVIAGLVGLPFGSEFTTGPRGFLAVWLVGWLLAEGHTLLVLGWMVIGREVVQLSPRYLTVRTELGPIARTRQYERGAVYRLRAAPVESWGWPVHTPLNPWSTPGTIAFDYGAKTVRFAYSVDEAEARMIVDELLERSSSSR